MPPGPYRAAVVTVSDSVSQGTREDVSGPAVRQLLEGEGWVVAACELLPDDFSLLRERLGALASDASLNAVFTTGGTGLGPRDRTPEATTSVMERAVPGLAELIRREGEKKTPLATLSRGVVGVKGKTLLVNLPGSPEGAVDSLRAVLRVLPHAVDVLRAQEPHRAASESATPSELPATETPTPAPETPAPESETTTPEPEPSPAPGVEPDPDPAADSAAAPEPPAGE